MKKKTRFLAFCLSIVMVFGILPATASAESTTGLGNFKKVNTFSDSTYNDVKSDDWFYENVKSTYEYGLMVGKGNNRFDTEGNVTVAETMTIAARLHSIYNKGTSEFKESSPWYQVYADYCKTNSIADPKSYYMNARATRAQFVQILVNAIPDEIWGEKSDVKDDAIPDVKMTDSYSGAVYKMYRAGILKGNDSNGTFLPNSNIRRSEVAAIVSRMIIPSLTSETPPTDTSSSDTYTVSFNTNGGSAVASQNVKKGGHAVKPKTPTKNGFEFTGWYSDSSLTKLYDFETVINANSTLYAGWVDVSDKTDSDRDGLTDPLEAFFGTNKNIADTDSDGLSDFIEVVVLALDPLKKDTDGDGITDGQEDSDNDGLTNIQEISLGTDPSLSDTDEDGLTDAEEVNKYHTDPLKKDTDDDGASDGKEINIGTDPLVAQHVFMMQLSSDSGDSVTPSVQIELSGEQVDTLRIEPVKNSTLFPEAMPGYMGQAYDFGVNGSFDKAEISFTFDKSLVGKNGFDPVIYYYDESNYELKELETTVKGNVASTTVNHFSTYILINRSVYQASFEWEDVWDASDYTGVQVVFVIDDSGSMGWNDPNNKRLTVAGDLIDKLPSDSKIGVVQFANYTTILTSSLTNDRSAAKSYLTSDYFGSSGGTYMYEAIDNAFTLYEKTSDNVMKVMIVLSDGDTFDSDLHSSVVSYAVKNQIKIYTVGLGDSTTYFTDYLKPLAEDTGAAFYLASNASDLSDIYKDIGKKIDIETDSDSDGIPDYYEDNMIGFNGVRLVLDKNNPDSDGDGRSDGEEVELRYEYNEDRTKVKVYGKIKSDPSKKDTDGDGFTDAEDPTPTEAICYKTFDDYKANKFGDQATITIFVDQPYENSRDVINFEDVNEYVGHTFVGIDYNGTEEYAGFWPYATDKFGNVEGYGTMRALLRESVNGAIKMNGGRYMTYGNGKGNVYVSNNDYEKSHKWDVARTFVISESKVGSLAEYAKKYTHMYNMVSDNCTTFAVNALESVVGKTMIYQHYWSYKDGALSYLAGSYYGYSPADAGEDIRRNYSDYIYYGKVKLNNGTEVDAIYDMSYPGCVDTGMVPSGNGGGGGKAW